jgi:hypothetical protein
MISPMAQLFTLLDSAKSALYFLDFTDLPDFAAPRGFSSGFRGNDR